MAGGTDVAVMYHQNHSASDTKYETVLNDTVVRSYDSLNIYNDDYNFNAPAGKEFSEWNTEQDGSGISYAVGDTVALDQYNSANLYAIWVAIPYLVTGEELADVADAIREKGGTSAPLEWPDEYVEAIGDIETGGGTSQTHSLTRGNSSTMYIFDYDTGTWVAADKQVTAGDRILVRDEATVLGIVYTANGVESDAVKLSSSIRDGYIAVFTMPDADTTVRYKDASVIE